MRKSYVQINGKLYEKAGPNSAIIDGVIWYDFAGTWAPADSPPESDAPVVMSDIQPYVSMIDGSVISSRSRHREHLRAHNCIEVGNERPKPAERPASIFGSGLKQELAARLWS